MIKRLLLLLSVYFISLSGWCQVLGFSITEGRKRVDIPIEINNNLVIIPVILNGMLPLKFILDTGVRTTILTEKTYTDILNLPYSRKYTISGPGGVKIVDAYVTNNVSLDLPGIHGEGHAMLVLEEDYLQLRNYLGTDVHGILGYELFSRFIIKIDYEKKILTVMLPEKFAPRKKFQKIPIRIEDTKPYVMAEVIQTNGTEMTAKFLIDTGASHSLMLDPKSDSRIVVPAINVSSLIGRGLGGIITGRVGRLQSFSLGSSVIDRPIANFPDPNSYIDSLKLGNVPRNGSIGGEILSRFTIIFDFPNEKIFIKKNHAFKSKFYFNLSGLTVKAKGSHLNTFEVNEVRSNSVSDKAGVKPGDLIMSVNGNLSRDLNLNQLIGFFNQKPGKKIHVEILRNGERKKVDFVLTDQI